MKQLLKDITDMFLSIVETYGAKVSNWAWNKRWKERPYARYIGTTGKIYTVPKNDKK